MLNVIVSRGKVWKLDKLPPKSIALDGAVQGPEIDLENQRISFDHHDNVIRTFTRATCQQVLDSLLLGFDPSGHTLYVNDIDGDTVLSVFLLQHPDYHEDMEMRLLVEGVGAIDAHGPSYTPLAGSKLLVDVFYKGVMAPVNQVQRNRTYATCDLNELLQTCLARLDDMMNGERWGIELTDDVAVDYTVMFEGVDWALIEAKDFAFPTLYADGYTACVVYYQEADGSYAYTIARKSDFVSGFPVGPTSKEGTILNFLNSHEKGWGGGSTIGGAPRNGDGSRSRIKPDTLFALISICLGQGRNITYCAKAPYCGNLVKTDGILCFECQTKDESEHIGAEKDELPEMMGDEVLQAARATAQMAKNEELD